MKRNLFFLAGLLAILCLVLGYSNKVLSYKAPYGILQFEALHEQEEDSIDVLFVGTSHVYSNINPAVIWKKNRIATFDLATGGAGLWNSYYAIQEALKTQSPQLIVLELYGAIYSAEYKSDREIMDANWGIENLLTRWKSLQLSAPKEKRIPFLLKYPYYHTRYQDIKRDDFEPYTHNYSYGNEQFFLYPRSNKKVYKGAVTLSHITRYEQFPDINPTVDDTTPISEKNEMYLKHIIELADSKKIPLLFIVSPYMGYSEADQKKYNYIEEITKEKEIAYINFNLSYHELGLIPQVDFAEKSHLSYLGMRKYSEFLGDYLLNQYGNLWENRKGKSEKSWDDYVEWENQVMYNFDLKNTQDMNEYLSKLGNPHHLIIISFDKVSEEELSHIKCMKNRDLENISESLIFYENGEATVLRVGDSDNDGKLYQWEIEGSNLVIQVESGTFEIIINRTNYKKVNHGINVVIYDKYVGDLVDAVGFDAKGDFMAVR